MSRPFRDVWMISLQGSLILAGMGWLAFAPPERGSMLVVPLSPAPLASTLNAVLAGGAAVTGAGPLPGTLLVRGERARIAATLDSATLLLAAPEGWCGR